MKKMTKIQKFEMLMAIPAVAENAILAEFVAHEIELLEKKNASDKKLTSQQEANLVVGEAILTALRAEPERKLTITEMIKAIPECAELTNQRVSAILRPMLGVTVDRVEEKRKAYFKAL